MIVCTQKTELEAKLSKIEARRLNRQNKLVSIRLDLTEKEYKPLTKIYKCDFRARAVKLAVLDMLELMKLFGNKHPAVIIDRLKQEFGLEVKELDSKIA